MDPIGFNFYEIRTKHLYNYFGVALPFIKIAINIKYLWNYKSCLYQIPFFLKKNKNWRLIIYSNLKSLREYST